MGLWVLIIASVLFAPSHIVISYKNVKWYLQLPVYQYSKIEYKQQKSTISYITTGVNHGRYKTKSKAVKARLPMQK